MSNNELDPNSFLAILFGVLENQDEDVKSAFFTSSKETLIKAFNDGVKACEENIPQSANPYPQDFEGAFSPNLAWNEGWMNTQLAKLSKSV